MRFRDSIKNRVIALRVIWFIAHSAQFERVICVLQITRARNVGYICGLKLSNNVIKCL